MMTIETIIDISTCTMTLPQVLAYVKSYMAANPTHKVWMDGDMYAIVAEVPI